MTMSQQEEAVVELSYHYDYYDYQHYDYYRHHYATSNHVNVVESNAIFTKEKEYIIIYTIQICTGSISFLASLAMAASIQFSKRKLSTPYRRLVYGLCIADILQSISFVTGPFASPAETPYAFWARGNTATCDVNGLMLNIGLTGAPMYVLALGVYYLCKLKRRMRDEEFRAKYEIWIHSVIIVWQIVINTILVFTRSFNPAYSGSCCLLTEFPYQCSNKRSLLEEDNNASASINTIVSSSCQRGSNSKLMSYLSFVAPLVITFFGICCCMFQLLQHAFSMLKLSPPASSNSSSTRDKKQKEKNEHHHQQEQQQQQQQEQQEACTSLHRESHNQDSEDGTSVPNHNNNDDNIVICAATRNNRHSNHKNEPSRVISEDNAIKANMGDEPASKSKSVHAVHDLSMTYKKEMIIQALSFIGVLFLVYLMPFIRWFYVITQTPLPFELIAVLAMIYPLGGLFYILVHNRTNAAGLKRREPQMSWCVALLIVFLNGGDMPSHCDEYCSQCKRERKRHSSSDDDDGEAEDVNLSEQYDSDGKYSLRNFIHSDRKKHSSGVRELPRHGSFLFSQRDESCEMEKMSVDNMIASESYDISSLGNNTPSSCKGQTISSVL